MASFLGQIATTISAYLGGRLSADEASREARRQAVLDALDITQTREYLQSQQQARQIRAAQEGRAVLGFETPEQERARATQAYLGRITGERETRKPWEEEIIAERRRMLGQVAQPLDTPLAVPPTATGPPDWAGRLFEGTAFAAPLAPAPAPRAAAPPALTAPITDLVRQYGGTLETAPQGTPYWNFPFPSAAERAEEAHEVLMRPLEIRGERADVVGTELENLQAQQNLTETLRNWETYKEFGLPADIAEMESAKVTSEMQEIVARNEQIVASAQAALLQERPDLVDATVLAEFQTNLITLQYMATHEGEKPPTRHIQESTSGYTAERQRTEDIRAGAYALDVQTQVGLAGPPGTAGPVTNRHRDALNKYNTAVTSFISKIHSERTVPPRFSVLISQLKALSAQLGPLAAQTTDPRAELVGRAAIELERLHPELLDDPAYKQYATNYRQYEETGTWEGGKPPKAKPPGPPGY